MISLEVVSEEKKWSKKIKKKEFFFFQSVSIFLKNINLLIKEYF